MTNFGISSRTAAVAPHRNYEEETARLRAMADVAFCSESRFDEKIHEFLRMGCRDLQAEAGVIMRVDGENFYVEYAVFQSGEAPKGPTGKTCETLCHETISLQSALAIESVGESQFRTHPAYEIYRPEMYIGATVMVFGRIYGTLSFSSLTPRADPFTFGDKEYVRLMALGAGSELERYSLMQELEDRVEERSLALMSIAQRDRIIGDIGLAIRTSLDTDQIEVQAAQLLGKAVGADHCFFGHTDLDVNHLHVSQGYSRPGKSPLNGEYKPADYVDFYRIFVAGGTVSVSDATDEALPKDTANLLASLGVAAAIAVPLFRDGRLEAVLCAAMEQPHVWSEHDASLVETVAAQTRTAIETAGVIRRERRIASTLEQALLPPLPSSLPGLQLAYAYRAALDESNVGGDFYAAYPVNDNKHALVIGDVSGKGLAAASQVATLQSMLRYALLSTKSLVEAVIQMNRVVAEHDLLAGFATLFIGIFDNHNNTLHYCSCGHEPPLIFNDGAIEILKTSGPPIGATQGAPYDEGFVQLKPNNLLMLYTDGLSEAGPDRRGLLGSEGLMEIFRRRANEGEPADIAANIIGDVVGFANGRLHDDACLIVVKVMEAGQPMVNNALSAPNTFESVTGQSQETSAEEQLRLLVDSVTDYAIFLLDRTGHIRTWNRGAERLKGYTAADVVGKHFSIFYTPEDVQRGHPLDELAIATAEGRYEEEGWRVRKDGTQFWANVVITALHDAAGNLCGFGKVTRDCSERRPSDRLPKR